MDAKASVPNTDYQEGGPRDGKAAPTTYAAIS